MVASFADPAVAPASPLRRVSVLAAVGGVGALTTAAMLDPATVDDGPVVCPFRLATGLPCPGCGLTRSWVYLAHGDIGAALEVNAFGIVSMLAVLVLVGAVAVALARRTPLPDLERRVTSRPFLALGVLWIAYGVARLGWLLGT